MTKLTWQSVVLSLTISMSIALSGWALARVADLPKEYVLKEDFNNFREENRSDHKEIMKILRERG